MHLRNVHCHVPHCNYFRKWEQRMRHNAAQIRGRPPALAATITFLHTSSTQGVKTGLIHVHKRERLIVVTSGWAAVNKCTNSALHAFTRTDAASTIRCFLSVKQLMTGRTDKPVALTSPSRGLIFATTVFRSVKAWKHKFGLFSCIRGTSARITSAHSRFHRKPDCNHQHEGTQNRDRANSQQTDQASRSSTKA